MSEEDYTRCEMCQYILPDGEELIPIFVGNPPNREERSVTQNENRVAAGSPSVCIPNTLITLNEARALLAAIEQHEWIEYETQDSVHSVEMDDVTYNKKVPPIETPSLKEEDISKAIITITPKQEQYADAMVCESCANTLRS